jgi:hypothetical protein
LELASAAQARRRIVEDFKMMVIQRRNLSVDHRARFLEAMSEPIRARVNRMAPKGAAAK